ncbi:hypothetical protein ACHWQZ_G016902 [Mnemiopsis leidyi]
MSDIKGSKLLRGNWVEAQSTQHLDEDIPEGHTTSKKVSKEGHKGLLAEDAELKEITSSTKAVYTKLPPHPRTTGIRLHNRKTELLFKVHDEVVGEEQAHLNKAPEKTDYTTTKQHYQSFHPEYQPVEHEVTRKHDFLTDQPATFWHEQIAGKAMPGLSAVADPGNPYRKNAKFSTPLDDLRTGVTSG